MQSSVKARKTQLCDTTRDETRDDRADLKSGRPTGDDSPPPLFQYLSFKSSNEKGHHAERLDGSGLPASVRTRRVHPSRSARSSPRPGTRGWMRPYADARRLGFAPIRDRIHPQPAGRISLVCEHHPDFLLLCSMMVGRRFGVGHARRRKIGERTRTGCPCRRLSHPVVVICDLCPYVPSDAV